MSDNEKNLFTDQDTEVLASAAEAIDTFRSEFLADHYLFATAALLPIFTKEDVLLAYKELLATFEAVIAAGQMAAETELITRDLTDINPQ